MALRLQARTPPEARAIAQTQWFPQQQAACSKPPKVSPTGNHTTVSRTLKVKSRVTRRLIAGKAGVYQGDITVLIPI